jgi:hypothetical protein
MRQKLYEITLTYNTGNQFTEEVYAWNKFDLLRQLIEGKISYTSIGLIKIEMEELVK